MAEATAALGRPGVGGSVRLEPTVVPTRLFRLGREVMGWHPVVVPARVAA